MTIDWEEDYQVILEDEKTICCASCDNTSLLFTGRLWH